MLFFRNFVINFLRRGLLCCVYLRPTGKELSGENKYTPPEFWRAYFSSLSSVLLLSVNTIISQKLNPFHEIKKVVIFHVNNQKEVKRVSLSIGFVPLKGSLKIKSTIPLKTARLTLFLLGGGGSIWTPHVVLVSCWNFLTFSKYPIPSFRSKTWLLY